MDRSRSREDVEKEARRLREVLKGRINQEQALKLLDEFGDPEPALDFVLNGNPDDVRHYLNEDPNHVQNLKDESEKLADDLNRGVENLIRQFACKDCLRSWWRRVPERKQVSKCRRCHQRYDCIPRNREWGNAIFVCEDCQHEFYGFAVMSTTWRVCHHCRKHLQARKVFPPKKGEVPNRRPDPYRRFYVPASSQDAPLTANHPCVNFQLFRDERYKIIADNIRYASQRHESTGSTVSTFLTGGSYETASISERPPLRDIPEDNEDTD
ncbi:hypothetical protein RRG08_027578 [Elysia crispata]|uniref:Uncharacterized protein n=1 Tax=Elysia crispata TaxID=231223 RepID=A0AAE1AEV3_9GAST|nr:hypothetical protein RRG08_027578 [Elysia crispata]